MLLADLSNDLADAKIEAANLKIALAAYQEENDSLKKSLNHKLTQFPTLSEGAYKFNNEEGLFCTACFDTAQKKSESLHFRDHLETSASGAAPHAKHHWANALHPILEAYTQKNCISIESSNQQQKILHTLKPKNVRPQISSFR